MNQDLIIRDVRLKGSRPIGNEVLEIDENSPIQWPIAWTRDKAKAYNSSFVRLRILAHGFEPQTSPPSTILGIDIPFTGSNSQGGGGIQFGKENLNIYTLALFAPLAGWLDWIDIYSCGTAFITPGMEDKWGDGNVLCSRLAQITQAPVRASTATQYYDTKYCEFGAWEGTVLTYGPKGNVINVEHSPTK